MKASAEKSSSTVSRTTASQPFFAKAGGGDFFAPVNRTAVPAVQAKMTVGKTGDKFEQEADKMANKVMRMPSPASSAKEEKIQRKTDERLQKKDETEKIQRAAQSEEKLQKAAMPEEKLQKKEKEEIQKAEQPKDKLQKKEEEKVQKAAPTEEKVQKKDDEKLKRQPEEKLQKAAMPEERLQKKGKEEIQKTGQSKDKLQKKEEEKLQKAALAEEQMQNEDEPSVSSDMQSVIRSKTTGGQPLSSDVRSFMEPRFSADFSNVRVHNDAEAAKLSEQLGAKAFTYQNHIFFAKGQYQPGTSEGKELLAHELTHTVQQLDGLQMMVNMTSNPSVDTKSKIDFDQNIITIEKLYLPELKSRNKKLIGSSATRQRNYKRDNSYIDGENSSNKAQDVVWKTSVDAKVEEEVEKMTKKASNKKAFDANVNSYYLIWEALKLIGSKETIKKNALVPLWNKQGKASAYDVDHIKELQLGGANHIDNMELLNFSANRASGAAVKNTIEQLVSTFLISETAKKQAADASKKLPNLDTAKKKYDITFSSIEYNNAKANFSKGTLGNDYWSKKDITDGAEHLKKFNPMNATQIAEAKGTKNDPVIYTSEAGGTGLHKKDLEMMKGITVTKFNFPDVPSGDLAGNIELSINPPSVINGDIKVPIPIYKMDGVVFGGHMPRRGSKKGEGGLEKILSKLEINGLSPADVDMVDIVPSIGLVVRGRIHPTLEIIKGFDLDFFIEGDKFGISKTISAGEITVPPPFKINAALLTIGAGNKGIFVQGDVLFDINKLGAGKISGLGSSNGDFGIKGRFDFDPKLFKKGAASIEVEYNNKDGWSAKGELEIGKGAVKGIKSGKIIVAYTKNVLEARGTAEVAIKGVKEVALNIKFGEDISEIEGDVKIQKLTGIKEGEGKLKIVKKGDIYDFSGIGKITPDIAGIETQVDFEFVNDIFTVDSLLQYKRDRLEGKLKLGITNQEMAGGVPTGKKSDNYTVFGGGQIALKITDSLQVTAGVNFLPNGEVDVVGRIDLPKKFKLFPAPLPKRKEELLRIPVNIPTPIPVIQIYVYGYINAEAEIGEGYLDDVFAEVKYNPSHPEEMSITGGMSFNMPAYAEVKAGVEFGLKASLAIASIRGGIDLSAALRLNVPQPILQGALKWSPATGFELDGIARIGIMPNLIFTGAFKITGEIDLLVGSLSKSWEWPFGSMVLSPNAPFGMEFPFKYNKNTPLNLYFNQIKFNYPSVGQLADSLKDSVVNKINDKFS